MNQLQLATLVQERRRTLRLSQGSLAEIAGVSVHCLSDIESGKGNPTLQVLKQLADALGLELRLELRSSGTQTGAVT